MSQEVESTYSEGEPDSSEGLRCGVMCGCRIMQKHKVVLIASVLFCLLLAAAYEYFSAPQYEVYTKVLIRGNDPVATSDACTSAAAGGAGTSADFENELEIMATKTLNKKVVKGLKLYTTYYIKGGLKDDEIDRPNSPYWVNLQEDMLDSLAAPVQLTLRPQESGVEATLTAADFTAEHSFTSFPAHIATPCGDVTIQKNPKGTAPDASGTLIAIIHPLEQMAQCYTHRLQVERTSPTGTIARLSLTDNLPDRACRYLDKLVDIYNEEVLTDQNIESTRTRDFIDERLADISKDLNVTEANVKQYKRTAAVAALKDAPADVTQSVLVEQKLVEVSTQIDLINYLIEYCNDKHNELQIVPSDIGLSDEALNHSIVRYNEAVLERNKHLQDGTDEAVLEAMTRDVENLFSTLRATLQTAKQQAVARRNDYQEQQGKYVGGTSASNSRGRALADINRLQEVKAGLYLMLLQKREENLLQLSAASNRAKQIEETTVVGTVSPSPLCIWLAALLLGILLPYILYYLYKLFKPSKSSIR